ncbi:hypothetical protein SK128_015471, partial [Halocaridina rubra]
MTLEGEVNYGLPFREGPRVRKRELKRISGKRLPLSTSVTSTEARRTEVLLSR